MDYHFDFFCLDHYNSFVSYQKNQFYVKLFHCFLVENKYLHCSGHLRCYCCCLPHDCFYVLRFLLLCAEASFLPCSYCFIVEVKLKNCSNFLFFYELLFVVAFEYAEVLGFQKFYLFCWGLCCRFKLGFLSGDIRFLDCVLLKQ